MGQNETIALLGFIVLIIVLLMLDIGVFHKKEREVSFKEAMGWTSLWISLALVSWLLIYFFGDKIHGAESIDDLKELITKYGHPISVVDGDFEKSLAVYRQNLSLEFITGYIIEYSLSIDNIFVIVMIFYSFGVDKKYYHKVLFWGILGAIIMRFLFIFISYTLIQSFGWILVIFGLILVYTGTKMFLDRNKEQQVDTNRHPVIRFAARYLPVDKEYSGHRFFIRKNEKLYVTGLFIVLLVIEFTDVIFAVDSVPAIFSITKDPFIIYFSNIFAIIGLRSLFFVVINILERFRYLNIGLSILLVFIGIKMITHYFHWVEISTLHSLIIVLAILASSILASIVIPVKKE